MESLILAAPFGVKYRPIPHLQMLPRPHCDATLPGAFYPEIPGKSGVRQLPNVSIATPKSVRQLPDLTLTGRVTQAQPDEMPQATLRNTGLFHSAALREWNLFARTFLLAGAALTSVLGLQPLGAAEGSLRVSGQARAGETTHELVLEKTEGKAFVIFNYKDPLLDLSQYRDLALTVVNGSRADLDLRVSALSDFDLDWKHIAEGRFGVPGGARKKLTVFMLRPPLAKDHPLVERFGNLHGLPIGFQRHWRYVQSEAIRRVRIVLQWRGATPGDKVTINQPFGSGAFSTGADALAAFDLPLVDPFGQLKQGDWPGKIKGMEDLKNDAAAESARSRPVSAPADRTKFGGWSAGPQLEATGYFRVARYADQWTFVDPTGALFWSLGVNTVGQGSETKIAGREALFEAPAANAIEFYRENLRRKYGADWKRLQVESTLDRMLEWGLNTLGAWSLPEMGQAQRVPHTLMLHSALQKFASVSKVPDPYSPVFERSLEKVLAEAAADHADDPWLLGVFVHNELHWESGLTLVEAILDSADWVPARAAFIDFLKANYEDIDRLNQNWATQHRSFAAIRSQAGNSGNSAYREDLSKFFHEYADRYFSVVAEAVRQHFPNHLYLGCRFHVFNPIVTAAAGRYCDIISTNVYRYGVENFSIPEVEDRPLLISEFHFGTRDYGNWGAGLTPAASAANQAYLYQAYVGEAIRHPNIVGAHWFQWSDQPVTGRFDGENFGVGLVSLGDRPHTDLIETIREQSTRLYEERF